MTNTNLMPSVLPHGAEWAIEASSARQLLRWLEMTDAAAHRREYEARRESGEAEWRNGYRAEGRVAIISVVGVLTKAPSSLDAGTSSVAVRRAVRAAATDKAIDSILLVFDSPGGTVAGTEALAQDVAAAARKKPCYAYVDDMACSAAYWVASQASAVYCGATAMLGSIGTYMVVDDLSRAYENAGIQVHVLSTGKYKGAGVPGARVTPEQIEAWQKTVDDLNGHFLSAIAKGRDMRRARVEELADGSVWIGQEAVDRGLADAVMSFDEVMADLRAQGPQPAQRALAEQDATIYSRDDGPPTGAFLDEALESALIAIDGIVTRLDEIRAMREQQQRAFSPVRLTQARDLHVRLSALLASCEALGEPPRPQKALLRAIHDGELTLAIHK